MSLRINQNISALSAHRWMQANDTAMGQSIERLSSGFRINSAADDAAGLVISENLRTQISGLGQAQKNTQDGINMLKTGEKALDEVEIQLRNIRDLALHAANANGNASSLAADQAQVAQALSSIDRIAGQTEFAGSKLFDTAANGNIDGKTFQIGANSGQSATFTMAASFNGATLTSDMHANQLGDSGLVSVDAIDLTTAASFDDVVDSLDYALDQVNGMRVSLGAFQKNNLESSLSSLAVTKENITASESAIRDTDMAEEMVSFTRNQILTQAAQAMMSQANQAPQGILQLLRQ